MDPIAKLIEFKKKTISLQELEDLFNIHSDSDIYSLVLSLEKDKILVPVLKSKKNGNYKYPLYLKYHIMIETDYSDALKAISVLHPSILKTGVLQGKPELYVRYKEDLEKLNRYLFSSRPVISVSRKERSFEIFDEEKRLEDSAFRSFLCKLGITPEYLHYYSTPEHCFNDFIPVRKAKMVLLICENKDIWFNIRRCMFEEGRTAIFNIHIDGVVYGEGNKVSESGALDGYTDFLGASDVRYLYWGDIDRAGLYIYQSILKNNDHTSIDLFYPGYAKMLELMNVRTSMGHTIPTSNDNRVYQVDYKMVLFGFPNDAMSEVIMLLNQNKRLPQEIINYDNLLKHYMR